MIGQPMILRHTGGGLSTAAGPVSLREAHALAASLRARLDEIETAILAAEQWRRAAGWRDLDAADAR